MTKRSRSSSEAESGPVEKRWASSRADGAASRWTSRLRSRRLEQPDKSDGAEREGEDLDQDGKRGDHNSQSHSGAEAAYSNPGNSSVGHMPTTPLEAASHALSGLSSFVRSTFKRKRGLPTSSRDSVNRSASAASAAVDRQEVLSDSESEVEAQIRSEAQPDKGKGKCKEEGVKLDNTDSTDHPNGPEAPRGSKKAKLTAGSNSMQTISESSAVALESSIADGDRRVEQIMRQLAISVADSLAAARSYFGAQPPRTVSAAGRTFADLGADERELLRGYFQCGDASNNRYLRRMAAASGVLATRRVRADAGSSTLPSSSSSSTTTTSLAGRMRLRNRNAEAAAAAANRALRNLTPENPLTPRELAAAASAESRSASFGRPSITNETSLRREQRADPDQSSQNSMDNQNPHNPFADINASSGSTLGALLGDILGNSPLAGGTHPLANLLQRDSNHRRHGTTSVIVQGALVARTLPSTPAPSTAGVSQAQTTDSARPAGFHSSESTTEAESSPASGQSAEVEPDGGQGDPQAATLEEQARMLTRLLSVAAAATAASLMTTTLPSDVGSGTASHLSPSASSNGSNPPADPIASTLNSVLTSSASNARPSSSTATSSATAGMSTSTSTESLARGLGSSLRERLSRIAPRARQTTTTADEGSGPQSQSHERSSTQQSVPAETTANPGNVAQSATLLSELLRESMSGGFGTSDPPSSRASGPPSRASAPPHFDRLRSASEPTAATGHGLRGTSAEQISANHAAQTIRVSETLQQVRAGTLERGSSGSFERFVHDLVADLDLAVRGSQPGAGGLGGIGAGARRSGPPPGAGSSDSNADRNTAEGDAADLDSDSVRRRGDLSSGQVSFFRLFRFAPFPTPSPRPTPLIPTLVVGVRSLGVPTPPSTNVAPGRQQPHSETVSSVTRESASTGATGAMPSASASRIGDNELPASRFVLFVSGGLYTEAHPLLSSPDPGREVLILIELLSLVTGVLQGGLELNKPPTATVAEIEQAGLRVIQGIGLRNACDDGEVLSITCEKCLVCLEEWQDEDSCRILNCKHGFHAQCVDEWITKSSNSCPVCRRPAVAKAPTGAAAAPVDATDSSTSSAVLPPR